MFGSVFEYIRDSIDDFLALLHQQLVRDQLAMQELFQRRDALHLFHAHMAILERSMQLNAVRQCRILPILFKRKFIFSLISASALESEGSVLRSFCGTFGRSINLCVNWFSPWRLMKQQSSLC